VPELSHDMPHDSPSDEVLLELGKLAWAATNLEDAVYIVCQCIDPVDNNRDVPVGIRIKQARESLQAQPDEALRARADAWLESASRAFTVRQAVLLSVPVTVMPLGPSITSGDLDPLLAQLPRDESRHAVHTPVTVPALRAVWWHIEAARAGWEELAIKLYENSAGHAHA
jgi:hypothetical protein